ncbi:MAG: hypothetical protein GY870_04705 [archaeon]|nr:hypothetical protein [archaeon]
MAKFEVEIQPIILGPIVTNEDDLFKAISTIFDVGNFHPITDHEKEQFLSCLRTQKNTTEFEDYEEFNNLISNHVKGNGENNE